MKKIHIVVVFLFFLKPGLAEVEMFFPQVVNGAGMSTELSIYLDMQPTTARTITVSAFRQDGSQWELEFSTSSGVNCVSPCIFTLTNRFESIVLTTNGIPDDLQIGWIKAVADGESIQGVTQYFIRDEAGGLNDSVAVPYAFPVYSTNLLSAPAQIKPNRDTALAVCNAWAHDPAVVKVILKDSESTQEFEFEIPANGQRALFLSELTGLKEFNGLVLFTQPDSAQGWPRAMALSFVEGKLGFLPTDWN